MPLAGCDDGIRRWRASCFRGTCPEAAEGADRTINAKHAPPYDDPAIVYRQKLRSMREAVDSVRVDDTIAAPIAGGQPAGFLTALAERDDWRSLTLFSGLLIAPYPVLQHPGVRLISGFYGPIERMLKSMGGRVDYLPADFIGWERYAMIARPRVMVSALAPMDEHGYLNFGVHAGATFNAFLEAARDPERLAIGEVVRDMPRVLGLGRHGGNRVHVSEVDCLVETDRPLFVLPEIPSPPRMRPSPATSRNRSKTARRCRSASGGSPTSWRSSWRTGPRATSASIPR